MGGELISFIVGYQDDLPLILTYVKKFLHLTIVNGRMFTGFLYIPLGIFLFSSKFTNIKGIIMVFVAVLFWITIPDYVPFVKRFISVVSSTGVFIFVNSIVLKDSTIYHKLRISSMVMYFTHLWVWSICYGVSINILHYNDKYGMVLYLLVTMITLLMSVIYIKYKNTLSVKVE